MQAGAVPLTGPGVTLTLDDAASTETDANAGTRPSGGFQQGRVTSGDLQIIVNGLWGAGAEAISINGHRLSSTAAIRFAGQAIIVDFRPLTRPYVITALGDSQGMQQLFEPSFAGLYLSQLTDQYKIRSVMAGERLTDRARGLRRTPRGRATRRSARRLAAPGTSRLQRRAPAPATPGSSTDTPPSPRRHPGHRKPGVTQQSGEPFVIPVLGLLAGLAVGLFLDPSVPVWLQPYLPIAVIAALDAVFGAIRAILDGIFNDKVFVVSFLSNVVVAAFIVFLGDQLGVGSQLSTGVVVVLGVRIFSNVASIRRHLFKA